MSDVRLSASRYDDCREVLAAFRNANCETHRDLAYFNWRYRVRPVEAEPIIVWAETAQRERVGALSLVPHRSCLRGAMYPVGILGDISVAPEWRGKGVAQRMFRYLAGLPQVAALEACVVLPYVEAAWPLGKCGWRKVTEIRRFVKFLDVEPRLSGRLPRSLRRPVATAINFGMNTLSSEPLPREAMRFEAEMSDSIDDRFDDLWNRIDKGNFIGVVRDRANLTWRYLRHPLRQYRIFTLVKQDQLCGYVVFHTSGQECSIDDLLCDENACKPAHLLSFFGRHLRQNPGISAITLRRNASDVCYPPLPRLGFIRRADTQDVMVMSGSESVAAALLDESRWLMTAGDKDV